MSEDMTVKVDLRNVQEQIEDNMKNAQTFGRRTVLATVGFWGLAYDYSQHLMKGAMELYEQAEKRGEELEQEWNEQFNQFQKNPDVQKVVHYVDDQVDTVSKNAKSVVSEAEKFLAQFTPAKVEETAKDVAITVESAIEGVFPGYDELSAKDIVARLPDMPEEVLIEVREYEIVNKNRVTVVREIDALLETPAEESA